MDLLQSITHYLCFGHQIVYSPTSLPTPVFVAQEYVGLKIYLKIRNKLVDIQAKRGRNIYNMWSTNNVDTPMDIARTEDYLRLTNELSYKNTEFLKNLRLNA